MNCPYCGGEVTAESTHCPYCGRENKAGIAFQKQVKEKKERNQNLKPTILKRNAGWLTQKMLTRTIVITMAINVILVILCVGFLYVSEHREEKKPASGSQAEQYFNEFRDIDNSNYQTFVTACYDFIDKREAGTEIEDIEIRILIKNCNNMLWYQKDFTPEHLKKMQMFVHAFFEGYIGLTKEEADFLLPGEDGTYPVSVEDDKLDLIVSSIVKKLKED